VVVQYLKVVGIVLLAITPVLAAVALAVKFAGDSRPLNMIDYRKVADAGALHCWAGNHLAALPLLSLLLGGAAFLYPALALVFLGLFVVLGFAIAVWVALGAEAFQQH
jgi:hypothetical protein